ncbi:MAG: sulfite exporter TauE/SafE family protein [Hyphomicrobiaceae bacterium]
MTDPLILTLVAATFLVGGLIKGLIGLGVPIIVLSMLAPIIGLKQALALFIVPGVVMNLWQAFDGPYFRSNLERLWSTWLVSIFAIWAGTFALARIDGRPVEVLLGIILAAYSVLSLVRPRLPPPRAWERWLGPTCGGVGGFLFGLTGTYMVPGVLYIEAIGLQRDAFVQALGMTFCIITASLGIGLIFNALMTVEDGLVSSLALIPAFAGLLIGTRFRSYISESLFRRIFFVWLGFTGVFISYRAYF